MLTHTALKELSLVYSNTLSVWLPNEPNVRGKPRDLPLYSISRNHMIFSSALKGDHLLSLFLSRVFIEQGMRFVFGIWKCSQKKCMFIHMSLGPEYLSR